ncbi:MAG: glutamate racemase [Candidatus Aureabacteria bacterium]|nr:glutamate racemase [Candidatus Auribacterota bacterium]
MLQAHHAEKAEGEEMKGTIGVFDSGLGGLTVVRHLRRLLPGADIVYFGDTARLPYGSKSPETVIRFSRENCEFLLSHNVAMIIVACNTSSAIALDTLRREYKIQIHGVVAPGARRAADLTRNRMIGVIGTHATIRSRAYDREFAKMGGSIKVVSRACPLFVPLAEEGWLDRPATVEIAREYLLPLKEEGIDVLVLGCTHYPILTQTVRRVLGEGISLVDSGLSCAEAVRDQIGDGERGVEGGRVRYFVTDMPERFKEIGRIFMGEEIAEVSVVHPRAG